MSALAKHGYNQARQASLCACVVDTVLAGWGGTVTLGAPAREIACLLSSRQKAVLEYEQADPEDQRDLEPMLTAENALQSTST